MCLYSELLNSSNTDWDFSLENHSAYDVDMAIPWMFRPSADVFAGLFSASDERLFARTGQFNKSKFKGDDFNAIGALKELIVDKPLVDTRQITANIKHWCAMVSIYCEEYKSILKSIRGQQGNSKWVDEHPNHYEKAIKALGEGMGTRVLKRKSLLGAYTLVVLVSRSVKHDKNASIKSNASATELRSALSALEKAMRDLSKLKQDINVGIGLTLKEAKGFGSILPGRMRALNKYYAASVNPYVGIVRHHKKIYSIYLTLLDKLEE